jgi:hypothetical protein
LFHRYYLDKVWICEAASALWQGGVLREQYGNRGWVGLSPANLHIQTYLILYPSRATRSPAQRFPSLGSLVLS